MTIVYRGYSDYVGETRRRTSHNFMLYGTSRGGKFTATAPLSAAFDEEHGYEPVTRPSLERICGLIQERCYPENQLKAGLKEARRVSNEIFAVARGNQTYNIGHLTFNDLYRLTINGGGRCKDSNHLVHDLQIGVARYLRGDIGTVYGDSGNRHGIFSVKVSVGNQARNTDTATNVSNGSSEAIQSNRQSSTVPRWVRVSNRLNRDRPIGERKYLERNIPRELNR